MYIKIKELFERPMTISDNLFIINKDDLNIEYIHKKENLEKDIITYILEDNTYPLKFKYEIPDIRCSIYLKNELTQKLDKYYDCDDFESFEWENIKNIVINIPISKDKNEIIWNDMLKHMKYKKEIEFEKLLNYIKIIKENNEPINNKEKEYIEKIINNNISKSEILSEIFKIINL